MLRAALSQPAGPPLSRPAGRTWTCDALEQAGNARAAVVGDQGDAVPAPHQLLGERVGGDHVAAGAAGGEDIVTGHQVIAPLHLTT